ncbi:MAG: alanine dehydrogenase, partial [Gammaproteobacteria bacterium]|nr:alanine dehydrogenase [Gammaproteobacteria bacterium]
EGRVSLTPEAVGTLVKAGHRVCVEVGAGLGAGFFDENYKTFGAEMVDQATAWKTGLVIKVKEPLAEEFPFLKDQMLFTFLHLSGAPKSLTEALLAAGTTGLAYETLEDKEGRLPLLAPMSAIAGNMAALVGAYYLGRAEGGKGVQLSDLCGLIRRSILTHRLTTKGGDDHVTNTSCQAI